MNDNICRFLPKSNESELNILHFVYETRCEENEKLKVDPFNKIHLAARGKGKIYFLGESFELCEGDIFFTFPGVPYTIASEDNFEYMYISYLGTRSNMLMERLKINKKNFIFRKKSDLKPIWLDSLTDNESILNLRCEGLFLYSLSKLSENEYKDLDTHESTMVLIRKFIDDKFADEKLSLSVISEKFSFNQKYISSAFKKEFGVGITQYITTMRIQKACTLMEQGFSSVKDIAYQCGFSDPLYFGRIFKKRMGLSPVAHIATINDKKHKEVSYTALKNS